MYCVALDPGQTTGVCAVPDRQKPWELETIQLGPRPHHRLLYDLLRRWSPEVLLCESFQNRGMDVVVLTPIEYVGVVQMYAQQPKGNCRLILQTASHAKQFWTDDKLRQYHLLGKGRHARDATRHYLYYQTFTLKDMSLLQGAGVSSVRNLRLV